MLRPDSDEALVALANALLEAGIADRAATYAAQAIQKNPQNPDAFLVEGAVQQQLGHPAQAKSAYERYLELAPHGQFAPDIRHILRSL